MSALEEKIDALYGMPMSEFTSARNALAKATGGAEGARVKKLEKPTVVPWAVNQLYWHDRAAWTRLVRAGQALRSAQIAALKGRNADIRGAGADHRAALTEAVQRATALAEPHGAHPAADQLARMLEALSLAADAPVPPGRFTELIQPSGFEALAGVAPVARPVTPRASHEDSPRSAKPPDAKKGADANARRAEADRETARKAQREQAEAALAAADGDLERAVKSEERTQARVDAIRQQLESAQGDLARAKTDAAAARRARDAARKALDRL